MLFKLAQVKSVRANLSKKIIILTFAVDASEQDAAEELAFFVGKEDAGVILTVSPHTPPMKGFVTTSNKSDKDGEAS